jgi:AraC-like DNA-binding protein
MIATRLGSRECARSRSLPLPCCGGLGDVVLEWPRRPAEGSFHSVGKRRVLAVADAGEDAGEQLCDSARDAGGAELAAKVGMSRAVFAARFTSRVGEPPLTYLTAWRMTLAADLLHDTDDTDDTIARIAREVGYQDAFAFSVAFKRAYGVSPSTWRRPAA